MIIYDPSSEADATRGTVCDALVECIDLAPTFVDVAGGASGDLDHILEGRSLLPFLHGAPDAERRDFAVCEYDYAASPLAAKLELTPAQARMFMVVTEDWKMIHFESGHRPMLFNLSDDPDELVDLGDRDDHAEVIATLYDKLFSWARRPAARTTMSNAEFRAAQGQTSRKGVLIGIVDEDELPTEVIAKYVGRKAKDMRGI
jgi:arylsulfatase A-like enzyme